MIQAKQEKWISRYWPALLIAAAWLWLFWPMMTGRTVVGFRDSAYLYYPLFKWIDAQWAAGQIPLWNPYCNFGMPVVADGTSSVFYPGKLIFFCRFLSFPARYGIYLAIHIPIAAAGAYWLAITFRSNRAGATLSAFSFAFGGAVLFQVTNVIYLVSAAWLPFAICCVWKMSKTGQLKWAIAAGVVCALMILGGDPQMVYHVGLIAVATLAAAFFRRKRRWIRTKHRVAKHRVANIRQGLSPLKWLMTIATPCLLTMILVTILLAAIQLFPSFSWAQLSERTNPGTAPNIYSGLIDPVNFGPEVIKAIFAEPVDTIDHAYQFSQPPWSVAELFWPNISGKPFPFNQRWASYLPGADRMWMPSLYMGLFTVLLAITGVRFWGRNRRRVWVTWLLLFFLLASFGWYGLVWLVNEVYPPSQNPELGPQVGGLYWLMNMVLPKYFVFRYPAKLMVVASLAISILAGMSLSRARLKSLGLILVMFLAISIPALCAFQTFENSWLKTCSSDLLFGPFDVEGAIGSINQSLGHAIVVSTLLIVLLSSLTLLFRRKDSRRKRAVLGFVFAGVTSLDLLIANSWLIPQVDSVVFESINPVHERLVEIGAERDSAAPIRLFRSQQEAYEPIVWYVSKSPDRLAEVITWQRQTLYPKHHLGEDVTLLGSFCSVWPESYQRCLEEWERSYRYRKVDWKLLRIANGALTIDLNGEANFETFLPASFYDITCPVEWMFEYDPLASENTQRSAVCLWEVESELKAQNIAAKKECRITEFKNNRFVAVVSTDRPKMLAFMSVADYGWKAKVRELDSKLEPLAVPVQQKLVSVADMGLERRGRFSEALLLPFPKAGTYEVEFWYSPIEFWIGGWISGLSWLVLFSIVGWRFRSRFKLVARELDSISSPL